MRPDRERIRPEGETRQDELEALREAHQRLAADLVNLRERHRREFAAAVAREAGSLMREWLEIVDDLERALAASREASTEALRDGLIAVVREARHQLEQRGVERMISVGADFDPQRHEAVGIEPGADEGRVHAEVKPGYLLDGEVLRPAEVIVGKSETR